MKMTSRNSTLLLLGWTLVACGAPLPDDPSKPSANERGHE